MSFDVILPFLRPIEHLILDHEISEIMVNGTGKIFIERCGLLEHVPGVSVEENTLRIAVKNIARLLGRRYQRRATAPRLPAAGRIARRRRTPAVFSRRDDADHPEVRDEALHGAGARAHRQSRQQGLRDPPDGRS